MIKTFKKALAIMMTVIFVFSLVPNFALVAIAEDQNVTLRLTYPVCVYESKPNVNYDSYMRGGTTGTNYQAIFQLDFSGYEYLLRDPSTKIQLSLRSGGSVSSYKLYKYNMYILDDNSDNYNKIYREYGDNSNPMTRAELEQYVTWVTSEDGKTPFIPSNEIATSGIRATNEISSDANMQVLLDALDASTDDSIVTVQFVLQPGQDKSNGHFIHSNENTFLKITCSNPEATPAKYVTDVANKLTWDMISSESIDSVTSTLTLPTKYLGTTIDWESTSDAVVNPETGVVTINPKANTDVTLTANLTYQPYEGDPETDTQTFNITIPKAMYDYASGTGTYYTGDSAFVDASGSSSVTHYPKITIEENKIGGKAAGDKYYKIQDASGNRRFSIPELTDFTKRDILEFSVYIPEDGYGFSIVAPVHKDVNNLDSQDSYASSFKFAYDGVYNTRFNNNSGKMLFPWKGDRWNHVVIAFPGIVNSDASGITYEKNLTIYVNGEEEYKYDASAFNAPCGANYIYLNGLCPVEDYEANNVLADKTTNWTTIAGYLDNLRWTNDDLEDIIIPYNTLSGVASSSYGVDNIAETLTVVGTATVQEILDSLTVDEDATPRVYSDGILIEDTSVAANDNMTIVVADTNGTYTERTYAYYDIRVISDGEYAFDMPYITFADNKVTGTVKLFNNTASTKTYKLYIAVYNDDKELIEVIPASLTAESGETKAITTNAVSYEGATNAKLFIWEEDGIKPALANVLYE